VRVRELLANLADRRVAAQRLRVAKHQVSRNPTLPDRGLGGAHQPDRTGVDLSPR
jgi:hypothetical protein